MRRGHDKPIEVLLTPEVIRVRSVRAKVDGDDVGYIRMTQFTEQTTEELKKAVADITARISKDKLEGYVLDSAQQSGRVCSIRPSRCRVHSSKGARSFPPVVAIPMKLRASRPGRGSH